MKSIRNILTVLILYALAGSCITPFDFDSIGLERSVVIDASLTDETTEHFVDISFTFEIDTSRIDPATGATVQFVSGTDERTVLREQTPGHYVTASDFAGVPGQQYTLEVTLEDGSEYRSRAETLPEPIPIDSIYGRYLTIPSDANETDLTGIQVFLDAHTDAPGSHNFRYTYRESYEVPVPYPSKYDWSGTGPTFQIMEREKPLGTCYRTNESSETIVATTRGLSENRIAEFPIQFINEFGRELAYNYIIEVTQYTISNDAHTFFRYLKESNEGTGSLSDRQLGTINGNIFNPNNSQEPVLGYFEVASVSKVKRIFNYLQYENEGIKTEEWICLPPAGDFGFGCEFFGEWVFDVQFTTEIIQINPRTGDTTIVEETFFDFGAIDGLVNTLCGVQYRIVDFKSQGTQMSLAYDLCGDCTIYGLLDRPSVWDD